MPPKKKKAAAPKKEEAVPALSEEERLVLAQAEALKAEEALIAANEARLKDLRRRRDEEHRRSSKNEKLIAARWLLIMRHSKSKELREAAVVMAQTHSRTMDRKNALLRSLEEEVDDAEKQRRRAAASHASHVDRLLTLHSRRALETSDFFATDARLIADAFAEEEREIREKYARHKRDMLDVLDAMEKAHESSFVLRRAQFETAREEIKSRNAEEFENAKNRLEATVRACEKMCEDAHKAYVTGTDTRAASFEQLTRQDSQSAKTIESRMRDLVRLARQVRSVKGKLESQSREWRAKNKALRKEKDVIRNHALSLAAETKKFRLEAEKKLKALLVGSNGALKALDLKLLEAEKILKLAAAARRMETERERVVPFGEEEDDEFEEDLELAELEDRIGAPLPLDQRNSGKINAASNNASNLFSTMQSLPEDERLSTGALDIHGRVVDETRYLERFFKRMNKAYLDERALSNERERLRSENADLRDVVKGYLDGVTVTEQSVRDPNNPLFVVNERVLKAQAERRDIEAREAEKRAGESRDESGTSRKLYNSRRGERSEREQKERRAPPVEVFVNAN